MFMNTATETNNETKLTNSRDIALSKRVQDRISWDKRISNVDVHVLSHSGQVTLIGKVDSIFKKTAAMEIVKNTKGVTRVINQLEIPTVFHREDAEIKNLIDFRLKNIGLSGNEIVTVKVSSGVVRLEGVVTSLRKKAQASGIVWELSGVRDCMNLVQIEDGNTTSTTAPIESPALMPALQTNAVSAV